MNEGTAAIIAAAIVGSITIIASVMTYIDNNRRKKDELFFKALDFMGGGAQERNLGISALELSLNSKKHQTLCVSLLIGSAIYLLEESKQKDAAHEVNNLYRIMSLLLMNESIALSESNEQIKQNYELLKEILVVKIQKTKGIKLPVNEEIETPKGLYVKLEKLEKWEENLNKNK